MGTKRRKTPRLDPAVEEAISYYAVVMRLSTPAQVKRAVDDWCDGLGERDAPPLPDKTPRSPDIRTVRERFKELRPQDSDADPWSIMDADGPEAEKLAQLYREVIERRVGGAPPTRGEMGSAARVLRLAPALNLWTAFKTAVAYQRRGDENTADLDAFVSFQAWRSVKAYQDFEVWVKQNHPSWLKDATINPQAFHQRWSGEGPILTWLRGGAIAPATVKVSIPAKEGVWLALEGLCVTHGWL